MSLNCLFSTLLWSIMPLSGGREAWQWNVRVERLLCDCGEGLIWGPKHLHVTPLCGSFPKHPQSLCSSWQHKDIGLHQPGIQGLLLSLAGTLLWVALCDQLLFPHRSLATWGNSTVKWSLWMALSTVTHTQAMCWWRSAQTLARPTLSSWTMGSTRYVTEGFPGLYRASLEYEAGR